MSDVPTLQTVTVCQHCDRAIGTLSDTDIVGWLHFSTHDGHKPEPKVSTRYTGLPGMKHCLVTKELSSGYICMNWQYEHLAMAVAKRDQFMRLTRGAFTAAIVSI